MGKQGADARAQHMKRMKKELGGDAPVMVYNDGDIALEAKKQLESNGNRVICITRQHSVELSDSLLGNPVTNELPEIENDIDGLVYFPGSIMLIPFQSLKLSDFLN